MFFASQSKGKSPENNYCFGYPSFDYTAEKHGNSAQDGDIANQPTIRLQDYEIT